MRSYGTLLMIVALTLAACSGEPGGGQGSATDNPPANSPGSSAGSTPESASQRSESVPSWREQRMALGRETYQAACASCHDTGQSGAPTTGNRQEWSGRSDMWLAVLSDHAKAGYLDMPGKGGQGDLSDEAVEAATEYMLERTFPELPRD